MTLRLDCVVEARRSRRCDPVTDMIWRILKGGAKITSTAIRVHILGSGTYVPYRRRSAPSIALRIGGQLCLIDCGSGTLKRIADAELDYRQITSIFFTHRHIDHTGDLASLLFALRNSADIPEHYTLSIVGPKNFSSFVNALRGAHAPWLTDLNFTLTLQELSNETVSYKEWRVTAGSVQHGTAAVGYRFSSAGKTVTISGDTDYCQGIIDLCEDADLAILECSTPDEGKIEGHLTPTLAAQIARLSRCKKLALTHLYPPCDEIDIVSLCAKTYRGEIVVAEDLMLFEV